MNQEVSNWLLTWFSSRDKIRVSASQALTIDYLQSGLLTSLEIVELVSDIESHFAIQFSEAEMQDQRFSTIGGIAELVEAALNRGRSSENIMSLEALNQTGPKETNLAQTNLVGLNLDQTEKVR